MKIACLLVLAACGGQIDSQNDSGTTAPDATTPSTDGVVIHACGPTDGIVHEFSFNASLTCKAPMIADDTLTITLDTLLTGPATIDLAPSGKAVASVCTIAGCDMATSGKLVVTSFDTSKNLASGSYTFTTSNAKVHAATFTNIPICANAATCG